MSGGVSEATGAVWAINSRVNRALLSVLTPGALQVPVGGGWTVLQHLNHMAEAKTFWASGLGPDAATAWPALPDHVADAAELSVWRGQLGKIGDDVLNVTEQASREPVSSAPRFPYATKDVFLLHLTHHDAHHRALVLSALRQAGHAVPEDGAVWGPWRVGG